MKKTEIINKLDRCRIMPIYSHEDENIVVAVAKACYQGGCRAFEFTNRVPHAKEIFLVLKKNQALYPDMLLGVGTVMNKSSAIEFIDAGADFIVSPIMKLEIGEACSSHQVTWIPGCASPTEIIAANDNGADFIKLFPASSLGIPFLSAMLSVAPQIKFVVTGGIDANEESITRWLKAGATCVGLGSNLLKKDFIASKNWESLQAQMLLVNQFGQVKPAK